MPSLERGLRVLELFRHGGAEIAAPEICRALQLPRTSVFRILLTLEAFGYLERRSSSVYRPGPALRRIDLEADAMQRAVPPPRLLHLAVKASGTGVLPRGPSEIRSASPED
ncbi:MAG: helix-turn-helix domain-containing protein [Burkholderiales bacterium]|nr:helix-turn-helix domain-containing protein [Burkholderiales bacterium]